MKADNVLVKAEMSADDAGTVSGIAWPFNGPDTEGDVINKGAFAFAPDVPMFMEHDGRQAVGVWKSYRETDAGLEVTGRLFIEASAPAREAHRLLRKGVITGLSISGPITGSEPLSTGGRNIHGVTVNEISLCKRPVNSGARVTIVKSITEGNLMENELENTPEAIADPVISAAELKALKEDMKVVKAKLARPTAANNNHPVAENDNSAKKAFAQSLRTGVDTTPESVRKAMTVSADELAGYIIAPEETSNEFIRNLVEFSPVRALADVRTAASHTVILPKRLSVTNAKWKGEAVASEASEPTFGEMEITIKELTTHVDLSNWLIEDASADIIGEVNQALVEDFGAKESKAFVGITDTAAPSGFMNEAAIASTINGHATNLSDAALIKLMYSLPGVYRNRGTWVMNGSTLATIRTLKDGIRVFDEVFAGQGGERFVKLIDQGSEGIRKTIKQANDLGLVMDDKLIARADEFNRKWSAVGDTIGTYVKEAVLALAFVADDFLDRWNKIDEQTTRNVQRALTSTYDKLIF